jgi:hypothetical protein
MIHIRTNFFFLICFLRFVAAKAGHKFSNRSEIDTHTCTSFGRVYRVYPIGFGIMLSDKLSKEEGRGRRSSTKNENAHLKPKPCSNGEMSLTNQQPNSVSSAS